jgi:hypothetical protein
MLKDQGITVRFAARSWNVPLNRTIDWPRGLTWSPIHRVVGASFSGLKRLEREADYSPPFSAGFKNM